MCVSSMWLDNFLFDWHLWHWQEMRNGGKSCCVVGSWVESAIWLLYDDWANAFFPYIQRFITLNNDS